MLRYSNDLSNARRLLVALVNGRHPTGPTTIQEDFMQYLVTIYLPDDFDPSLEDEATSRDIDALNEEMVAAGVRLFVGGLGPLGSARSIRAGDGGTLVTDGPYLETKEHVGGLWVLDVADQEEALTWGRKAAVACRTPVEVRPFG
jgi:hypothetical protein